MRSVRSEVKEAEDGDILKKGCVYIAPGGKHMEITKCSDGRHKVSLNDEPAIGGLKPCADIMYRSYRESGYDEITCVVLTGMGADGTKGILSLREKNRFMLLHRMPRPVWSMACQRRLWRPEW